MENRVIKFRVWDGDKMYYDLDIIGFISCFATKFGRDYLHNSMQWDDEKGDLFCYFKHLMQFTGLTDKSGKDIYEADIVRTESGKNMIVKWNDWFAGWYLDRDDYKHCHWFGESCDPKNCEVIGNVHENPELLNF
jgi:uncharacterized phage protein (TIGR01671 family)